MAKQKKITVKQLENSILKAQKKVEQWTEYAVYLSDFKVRYIQALNDGTTPPNGPKNPPGTGH